MRRYEIETGPHRYEAVADSMEAAVTSAFKKYAPKNPGLLTRARSDHGRWLYIASDVILRRAGFAVNRQERR